MRCSVAAALLVPALVSAQSTAQGTQARIDLLITNGTLVDGTGAPARRADIAIRDGRISRVAPHIGTAGAARVLDAAGLMVAPGFIDPHAHITAIAQHATAENFIRQGITTIFNSLHSLDQPYPLGAFLDTLRVAPNTLWSAGHTWARTRVMQLDNRAPTTPELDSMKALVSRAMDDGAFGLGTGLEYVPATYAKTDELIALARAAKRPHALYVTHLRDEGAALMAAIDEALTIGAAASTPVHISHLKSTGADNWGRSTQVLARIDRANAAGRRTTFDVYPYAAYSTTSEVLFPNWLLANGQDSVVARIRNPVIRARLHSDMVPIFKAQTGGTAASVQFRNNALAPDFTGKTLDDYLRARGKPTSLDNAIDALIDMQAAGGFTGIVHAMSETDIEAFLQHPRGMISTDGDLVTPGKGFPHPRSYGAFPRVFATYVRERHLFSIEAAVAKMTSMPARSLGLTDRGTVRRGNVADIVIFDAQHITDKATFTDPHHYAEGVVDVLVNGVLVLENGVLTGAKPGIAIRRR